MERILRLNLCDNNAIKVFKTSVLNTLRPGRREPRAQESPPKTYQLLTSPRHKFKEIPCRAAA